MRLMLTVFTSLIGLPLLLIAYKEGPFPNVTGGFGEPSCHLCHFDNALNAPGGALAVEGVPSSYSPGRTYAITIRVKRSGLSRGGFEIGARFVAGPQKGAQAGTWRPLDGRVQIVPSADARVQFAQHTAAGSEAADPGELAWTVEWIAPATAPASIEFDAAANASNDDASPLGDFIYLRQALSRPTGRHH